MREPEHHIPTANGWDWCDYCFRYVPQDELDEVNRYFYDGRKFKARCSICREQHVE